MVEFPDFPEGEIRKEIETLVPKGILVVVQLVDKVPPVVESRVSVRAGRQVLELAQVEVPLEQAQVLEPVVPAEQGVLVVVVEGRCLL